MTQTIIITIIVSLLISFCTGLFFLYFINKNLNGNSNNNQNPRNILNKHHKSSLNRIKIKEIVLLMEEKCNNVKREYYIKQYEEFKNFFSRTDTLLLNKYKEELMKVIDINDYLHSKEDCFIEYERILLKNRVRNLEEVIYLIEEPEKYLIEGTEWKIWKNKQAIIESEKNEIRFHEIFNEEYLLMTKEYHNNNCIRKTDVFVKDYIDNLHENLKANASEFMKKLDYYDKRIQDLIENNY